VQLFSHSLLHSPASVEATTLNVFEICAVFPQTAKKNWSFVKDADLDEVANMVLGESEVGHCTWQHCVEYNAWLLNIHIFYSSPLLQVAASASLAHHWEKSIETVETKVNGMLQEAKGDEKNFMKKTILLNRKMASVDKDIKHLKECVLFFGFSCVHNDASVHYIQCNCGLARTCRRSECSRRKRPCCNAYEGHHDGAV
jgi:hypothetical protein